MPRAATRKWWLACRSGGNKKKGEGGIWTEQMVRGICLCWRRSSFIRLDDRCNTPKTDITHTDWLAWLEREPRNHQQDTQRGKERRCDEWLRNSERTPHWPCTLVDGIPICSVKPHAHIPGDIVWSTLSIPPVEWPHRAKRRKYGSGFDRIYSFLRDCIPVGVYQRAASSSVCAGCATDGVRYLTALPRSILVMVYTLAHVCAFNRIWAIFGADEVVGKRKRELLAFLNGC